MNVYAFYDPIGEQTKEYTDLISLWERSWRYYGWNPIILTLKDAQKHERYNELHEKAKAWPTINGKQFEIYCFLRWLAIANIGGWYTDVDMMNYGFMPYDYGEGSVTTQQHSIAPATVYLTKKKYNDLIIDSLMNYEITELDFMKSVNQYHVSDLNILNPKTHLLDVILGVQADYMLDPKWTTAKIVHYTTPCPSFNEKDKGKTRVEIILEDERSKVFCQ